MKSSFHRCKASKARVQLQRWKASRFVLELLKLSWYGVEMTACVARMTTVLSPSNTSLDELTSDTESKGDVFGR